MYVLGLITGLKSDVHTFFEALKVRFEALLAILTSPKLVRS
jgi:hypothetical protein